MPYTKKKPSKAQARRAAIKMGADEYKASGGLKGSRALPASDKQKDRLKTVATEAALAALPLAVVAKGVRIGEKIYKTRKAASAALKKIKATGKNVKNIAKAKDPAATKMKDGYNSYKSPNKVEKAAKKVAEKVKNAGGEASKKSAASKGRNIVRASVGKKGTMKDGPITKGEKAAGKSLRRGVGASAAGVAAVGTGIGISKLTGGKKATAAKPKKKYVGSGQNPAKGTPKKKNPAVGSGQTPSKGYKASTGKGSEMDAKPAPKLKSKTKAKPKKDATEGGRYKAYKKGDNRFMGATQKLFDKEADSHSGEKKGGRVGTHKLKKKPVKKKAYRKSGGGVAKAAKNTATTETMVDLKKKGKAISEANSRKGLDKAYGDLQQSTKAVRDLYSNKGASKKKMKRGVPTLKPKGPLKTKTKHYNTPAVDAPKKKAAVKRKSGGSVVARQVKGWGAARKRSY